MYIAGLRKGAKAVYPHSGVSFLGVGTVERDPCLLLGRVGQYHSPRHNFVFRALLLLGIVVYPVLQEVGPHGGRGVQNTLFQTCRSDLYLREFHIVIHQELDVLLLKRVEGTHIYHTTSYFI